MHTPLGTRSFPLHDDFCEHEVPRAWCESTNGHFDEASHIREVRVNSVNWGTRIMLKLCSPEFKRSPAKGSTRP